MDTFKQDTDLWWWHRRGLATASNADRIITPATGAYSTQSEGYANELIGDVFDSYYGCKESYQSAAMKNGVGMEPSTRAYYELARECEVEEVGLCVTDDSRFACSPDGLMRELRRGVEIKNPKAQTQVKYLRA